jgi:hypothetical protein
MKSKIMIALILSAVSASTQAGNWMVKNGWCQTMTEDGQAMVMLKNNSIGVFGLQQGCPYGPQQLMGSRISINGNLVPTTHVCSQQYGWKAFEAEAGQAPGAARTAILSIAERDTSVVQAFGGQMKFTRGDMLKICPQYVSALKG